MWSLVRPSFGQRGQLDIPGRAGAKVDMHLTQEISTQVELDRCDVCQWILYLRQAAPYWTPTVRCRQDGVSRGTPGRFVLLIWVALCVSEGRAWSDPQFGETLSGPDSHEAPQETSSHLLGDWDGLRTRLFERGVRFDFSTSAITSGV
jgi:hypothetical protein